MATSYAIFAVVFLLCVSGLNCRKVTKGSDGKLKFENITEVRVKSELNTEFDGKGLEPWYDVAKSFIHTVQKDDPPYGEFKNEGFEDYYIKFLKGWELPFLVVFGIGFLFAIIVPIVGFCFCCCRCCGNCGGEMVQKEDDHNSKKCVIFSIILSIITLLMFTGCLMAFVSNDRITDTVKSYRTTPINALNDAESYFNQTVNVVSDEIIGDLLDVLNIISDDVVGLPGNISQKVIGKLTSDVKGPLDKVIKLANETKEMRWLLGNITEKTDNLKTKSVQLESDLNEVKSNLTRICQGSTCSGISYQNDLKTDANFSALPDVTKELDNVAAVLDKNDLEDKAKEGLQEFYNIEGKIGDKTKKPVKDIVNEVEDARKQFKNDISKEIKDKVNEVILDKTKTWKSDINEKFDDQVEPYDKYRYYAGIGITCLILLPVVLLAIGLLCGICGHDKERGPTDRGSISHMGGNSLMAAVGFMFIFVFFLMLFTSICFIVGAHLEKGCSGVRDENLYTNFIDNPAYWSDDYILGEKILNNGTIKLTFESILESCRKNEPIFKAIQGSQKWNLAEKFSVKDKLGDFEKQLNTDFDVKIKGQNILNNETTEGLENLADSGVDKINFTKFIEVTNKAVVRNLTGLKDNLREKNNTNLTAIADRLGEIEIDANEMQNLSKSLQQDVNNLQNLGANIGAEANTTLNEVKKASDDFKQKGDKIVSDVVNDLTKVILGYVDDISGTSVKVIENDLGRCRILANIYDAAVNLLCRETVLPFNGFWFSIGFCLFFYIPAIIFAVKLAKHYRRMNFEEGFDRQDVHEMTQMDRNKQWHNQGNAVYPK